MKIQEYVLRLVEYTQVEIGMTTIDNIALCQQSAHMGIVLCQVNLADCHSAQIMSYNWNISAERLMLISGDTA